MASNLIDALSRDAVVFDAGGCQNGIFRSLGRPLARGTEALTASNPNVHI
jgi:hypothetical protein